MGDTVYKLKKHSGEPIVDTTVIEAPTAGGYLLQQWKIDCNDENNNGKKQNFRTHQHQNAERLVYHQMGTV